MSFKGELELRAIQEEKDKNSDSINYKSEYSSSKLVAKTNVVFWTQYFGLWRGKTELDPGQDPILKTLAEFTLQKNKDEI
jgi:hypothetical protein